MSESSSCSSRNTGSRSAFRRLLAGSVSGSGVDVPRLGETERRASEWSGCSPLGLARSLKSLEALVSSIKETTQTVSQVSSALEQVWRENATAAQADAGQIELLVAQGVAPNAPPAHLY